MTRDDIVRWAKEAGWKRVGHNPDTGPAFPVLIGNLERFAALVAEAEREACAKVAKDQSDNPTLTFLEHCCARHITDAIRARGEK